MSNGEYKVSLCTSADQLKGVCAVRVEVFVTEQGFELSDEIDQYDPLSAHFALTHSSEPNKVLGTLRLIPYPLPIPKSDQSHIRPDPDSDFPLGASRTEAAIAGDFVSAAWSSRSKPVPTARDPSDTSAEAKQSAHHAAELGGAKLGRLALLKSVRGKKLGHLLVREAEAWLARMLSEQTGHNQRQASNNARTESEIIIKLSSQIYVIEFYTKLGFTPIGDQYDEDGAPHQLCTKQITLSPLET